MSKPKPDPIAEEQMTNSATRMAALQDALNVAATAMSTVLPAGSLDAIRREAGTLHRAAGRLIRAKAAAKKRTLRVLTARRQRAMDAAAQAEKDLAAAGV